MPSRLLQGTKYQRCQACLALPNTGSGEEREKSKWPSNQRGLG